MKQKKLKDITVKLDMSFEEAMKRLVRVKPKTSLKTKSKYGNIEK